MTKQVGRAPGFIGAVRAGGIKSGVAVDMACARALGRAGMTLGHVGHLVQVPRDEAPTAASLEPANWTVFTRDKAGEAAAASHERGRTQDLLARIYGEGDRFYPGHEGGFPAPDVLAVAHALDALDGGRFAGVTTFPATLFDRDGQQLVATPNLTTLERAAERLRDAGVDPVRINAPGTTSSATLSMVAAHGATQVEPGHGLTGTTPLHHAADLPELPAICYVTEVSHEHAGRAFAFGGGLYIDPVFGDYRLRAIVAEGDDLQSARTLDASIPPAEAIDYYAQLELDGQRAPAAGATVVFGFRAQAFVTRAYVAGIRGAGTAHPTVSGIWNSEGEEATWPI